MPKGGAREGAGRKPGVPNKRTAELLKAAADGILPLDYMLQVMRDITAEFPRRDDMAKAAAPYLHHRLQSTTVTGSDGGPIKVVIDKDDAGLL